MKFSGKHIFSLLIIAGVLALFSDMDAMAQGRQAVQVSGVIIGSDSTSGVPGVHIYSPRSGRGTTSNLYGYFSHPFVANDSIIVSAVGYQKYSFVVPRDRGDNITIIIELSEDTTYLPAVEVFPFPTEKLFKEAILAMQLPDEEGYQSMRRNLDDELMARMARDMKMDASMNYKYYQNQQFNNLNNRYGMYTIPLLNPFAWANFIKSIKRGDFKKKD